jgi:phage tail-like protein
MTKRNANDTTWHVLRYEADFVARTAAGSPTEPELTGGAFFDADRHMLELLPAVPAEPAEPPAAGASDPDGVVYFTRDGELLVRRCDGSECPVLCEPGVIADARGVALDRRGLLYVADRLGRRVIVLDPDEGHVEGVLVSGLREPLDVVVSPSGTAYVADREAGEIAIFDSHFSRRGSIVPSVGTGTPRPIAVALADDLSLLVADELLPRLLHFDAHGRRLGDVSLEHASSVGGGGARRGDVAWQLIALHRAARLAALHLARSFEPTGTFQSRFLDAGRDGTQWHAIEIDGELPEGTELIIETRTADTIVDLASASVAPSGRAASLRPGDPPDRLVFSPPGRFLQLRVTLLGGGGATPSLRAIRVYYPRISYLDLLPRVFRRDPQAAQFLEHFLALFEHVFTGIEDRYERFSSELDPELVPAELIDWLGGLIDIVFDPSWPLARRRHLLSEAVDLFKRRGTPWGIARAIEIYTGIEPVILERFLERPNRAAWLGSSGVLGASFETTGATGPTADELAHRFTVVLGVVDPCDREAIERGVRRVLELNKPAHTLYTLRVIEPGDVWVGELRVGIDALVADVRVNEARLRSAGQSGEATSLLGGGAVLGTGNTWTATAFKRGHRLE